MSHGSSSVQALTYGADTRRNVRGLIWAAMWSRITETAATLAAGYTERRRASRTAAELAVLSDRMLADIGVQRSDIERVARHGRDVSDPRR